MSLQPNFFTLMYEKTRDLAYVFLSCVEKLLFQKNKLSFFMTPQVIRVKDASYALDTPGHCGTPIQNKEVTENCSLENAQAIPKFRCNNRPACWVFHGLFHTDPCPGERKYAIVNYTCE